MPRVFIRRKDAEKYAPKKDETLEKIVKDHATCKKHKITWQDVALYNWATKERQEVNRALIEFIGCPVDGVDWGSPEKTKLDPAFGPKGKKELLIPKPWETKGLAVEKTHKVTVKRRRPMPAIAITILSKWFIPGKEACDLKYNLEGSINRANKVDMDVRASNPQVAEATKTLRDMQEYQFKKKNYLVRRDRHSGKSAVSKELTAGVKPRFSDYEVKKWKGEAAAFKGLLSKRKNKKTRYITVANSPYSVMLRYYRSKRDRYATIELEPFWPRWTKWTPKTNPPATDVVTDSLKINYKVRYTNKLRYGQLIIVDKDDNYTEPVFRKALGPDDLKKGSHTFDWAEGKDIIKQDRMPYRVQIQGHTSMNRNNGVAVAVMHTEVRIYAHPETLDDQKDPYVAANDKDSLLLSSTRNLLAAKKIAKTETVKWAKLQLARGGYHPGPVDKYANDSDYKRALKEFKRSVPKRKTGTKYKRLRLHNTVSSAVKKSLEDLATKPGRRRPWFGDPANNRADLEFDSDDLKKRLRKETAGDLIIWVDDRHYYTEPKIFGASNAVGQTIKTTMEAHEVSMGNYAKFCYDGDAVITMKAQNIPRPWIPLGLDLILLSKTVGGLDETVDKPDDATVKAMRRAIGPIRVDWSFDEIEADPPVVPEIQVADYGKTVTRSKAYVEAILKKNEKTHARKDIKRTSKYYNCPTTHGGERPPVPFDYVKRIFGVGGGGLGPWYAHHDTARETIQTMVHEDLGQKEEFIFDDKVGHAGVYFRPSTIAGDGYLVRAQVRFDEHDKYKMLNLENLKNRYPVLPQVHTPKMRVWRKASLRSYLNWSDANSWAANEAAFKGYYAACHLHLVNENGAASVATSITDYFANDANFKSVVKKALVTGVAATDEEKERAKDANIALNNQRLWPWADATQYGIYEKSANNATKSNAMKALYKDIISPKFTNLACLFAMEWAKTLEKDNGLLRGHTVVEFTCTDPFYLQQYTCNGGTTHKYFFVETSKTGNGKLDSNCPGPGCAGKLKETQRVSIGHYSCTNGHTPTGTEANHAGGAYTGVNCTTAGCGQTVNPVQANRQSYRCKANHAWSLVETAAEDTHDGARCPTANCANNLFRDGQWKESYKCDKCNQSVEMNEPHNEGGTHVNAEHTACTQNPKGKLQRKAPVAMVKPAVVQAMGNKVTLADNGQDPGYKQNVLPVSSMGIPIGVAFNHGTRASLWGHEVGHNRYLTHAASAPGHQADQHDTQTNGFNWAAIKETDVDSQKWDRACLMSYVGHQKTHDAARDKMYPCGKCILRTRGWKVQAIPNADVPAGTKDP